MTKTKKTYRIAVIMLASYEWPSRSRENTKMKGETVKMDGLDIKASGLGIGEEAYVIQSLTTEL